MTGQYREGQAVWVRYSPDESPRPDRDSWPWLAGEVEAECAPPGGSETHEWHVRVTDERAAYLEDGEEMDPLCFRDASELRPRTDDAPPPC